jgi:Leucine-rich repeat (LRR) protein
MFSGPLPVLPLQHLVSFSAETNQLSGSIPAEICQANSLQSLILHNNNLTGSIMETFKGSKNLTELNLLGNRINGQRLLQPFLHTRFLIHLPRLGQ